MHPTLAGFYPFLLGSPARCAFLLYLCLYICLGSPARSRLSRPAVALTIYLFFFFTFTIRTTCYEHMFFLFLLFLMHNAHITC